MKNRILKIIDILKDILLIIYISITMVFIFMTLGLGMLIFDSVNKVEYKDDWELMREWKQKEDKEKLRIIEDKSIKVSVWTPKIKGEKK